MEKKTKTELRKVEELYKKYENSILDYLIYPKSIPTKNKEEAYFNLNKGKPTDINAKKRNLLIQIELSKKSNLSDDNKGQKCSIKRETKNYNNQSDSQNNIKIQGVPDKVNFGSHSDYSFFEYWSREIVFQLFNYHQMFYFNYNFSKPQNMQKTFDMKFLDNYIRKRDNLKIIKNKKSTVEDKKEIDQKNKKEENPDIQNNIQVIKENEKNEENPDHPTNFQVEKEKKGKIDENINIQNNIQVEEKKGKIDENTNIQNNIQVGKEKTEEYIEIQTNIQTNKEKEKAEEKFKSKINEEPSNEKNTIKKQNEIGKQGNINNMINCISDDNKKKIDEEKLMNKINNGKFERDFDFVIPDITKDELKRVLENKEIGPFLFYDNINIKDGLENFDIIGEVKESIEESDKNVIQLVKYLQMFFYLKDSEEINKKLGLKMKNIKIIMYVVNSEYKNYLMKLIEYKNHINQFTSINNKFKNDYFGAIIKSHIDGKKNILIDILVQSKAPYIFLYLPNAVITWSIHLGETDRLKKEMKKKDTEVNDLKIQMKRKDDEVGELKIQMKRKDNEVGELKLQINGLIDITKNLNKIIEDQNKQYQALKIKMNEILSNYNLLIKNKNIGTQSTNNES